MFRPEGFGGFAGAAGTGYQLSHSGADDIVSRTVRMMVRYFTMMCRLGYRIMAYAFVFVLFVGMALMPASKALAAWPSTDFGSRFHPVYGYSRFHSGLDIAAPSGLPIVATAAGNVTYSGWMQGYGYAVEVDHGNGLKTLYAHCSQVLVQNGQYVQAGQKVALVGSTGVSTGPHCHYEVLKNGNPVNPIPYL